MPIWKETMIIKTEGEKEGDFVIQIVDDGAKVIY